MNKLENTLEILIMLAVAIGLILGLSNIVYSAIIADHGMLMFNIILSTILLTAVAIVIIILFTED